MSPKKVFFGMILLTTTLGASIIVSVVLGNIWLQKHSKALVAVKLENHVVEDQKLALIAANRDIETYNDLDNIAKSIVPRDKDQARAIRDIVQIANENNITIETITFPTSNLGTKQPAATTESGAPAAPIAPKETQVKAVPGVNGVFSMQLDVTPSANKTVSYDQLINFLERLENNRRTAQISRISIAPKTGGLNFTMSVNIFIKP